MGLVGLADGDGDGIPFSVVDFSVSVALPFLEFFDFFEPVTNEFIFFSNNKPSFSFNESNNSQIRLVLVSRSSLRSMSLAAFIFLFFSFIFSFE